MTAIIERVCATARDEHAPRVRVIHVTCGTLSGVVPDALRFCFDVCTAGTIAEGATLDITMVPARWRCRQCGAETDDAERPLPAHCTRCGADAMELSAGRQFQLVSIEVD